METQRRVQKLKGWQQFEVVKLRQGSSKGALLDDDCVPWRPWRPTQWFNDVHVFSKRVYYINLLKGTQFGFTWWHETCIESTLEISVSLREVPDSESREGSIVPCYVASAKRLELFFCKALSSTAFLKQQNRGNRCQWTLSSLVTGSQEAIGCHRP